MRTFTSLTLAVVFTAIVGCSSQTDLSDTAQSSQADSEAVLAAVNKNCPVMGSAVTDDGGRYDWNGKTVGFCCPGCIDEFAKMSDEQKAQAIADADGKATEQHDHQHEGHDHSHSASGAES